MESLDGENNGENNGQMMAAYSNDTLERRYLGPIM